MFDPDENVLQLKVVIDHQYVFFGLVYSFPYGRIEYLMGNQKLLLIEYCSNPLLHSQFVNRPVPGNNLRVF